jgi:dolichyl-phosphate-mannose--protein O-mannosyl transferase
MTDLFVARSNALSSKEVAYGSEVTIKNSAFGGGLLHSHPARYIKGSEQQQVTVYHHNDTNNHFIIYPVYNSTFKISDFDILF